MSKANIIISDWQVLFREGIHFALSADEELVVVAEADGNDETGKLIERDVPDISIINFSNSYIRGLELMKTLKKNYPSMGFVFIMDDFTGEDLFNLLVSGANGCIFRTTGQEDLLRTVKSTAEKKHPVASLLLQPEIAVRALKEYENYLTKDKFLSILQATLTKTEEEFLNKIAENNYSGASDKKTYHMLENIRLKLIENHKRYETFALAEAQLAALAAPEDKDNNRFLTREEFSAYAEIMDQKLKNLKNDVRIAVMSKEPAKNA
jgi:DNA-binding NarL/FixJ family response regulator